MMREARTPHLVCGSRRTRLRCLGAMRTWGAAAVALMLCAFASSAQAQDPSVISPQQQSSSFPKSKGGILGGPTQQIDKSKPLYLQGDELIYDTKGNKIRARGNVEIFYNNYILKADQVFKAIGQTLVGSPIAKDGKKLVKHVDKVCKTRTL